MIRMDAQHSRERARRFHENFHGKPKQRSLETHSPGLGQFQTPRSVSADEEQHNSTNTAAPLINGPPKKTKKSLKQRLRDLTAKQWIIIGIVAGIVLGGGGLLAWKLLHKSEELAPPVVHQQEEKPKSATVASNLTGLQVKPEVNKRPVTAVMIENSLAARPQSGILEAGVMFEAIAEGGITRFTAYYQDREPDYVGPVRSVRKPFLQWLLGFDAAVAHVGGSGEALQLIKDWNVKDLDQFSNSGAFWRIGSRAAPHNMYTSIANLRKVEKDRGYGAAKYTSLERKGTNPAPTPSVTKIDLDISGSNYGVHYDYDKKTNSYKRSVGGAAHLDERSGKQLSPKVVVVPVMSQGYNGIYTTYETIGSGTVFIFQDGRMQKGTWHKASNSGQFTFTWQNGKPLKLNPGQTWFTIVGSADRVSYGK